MKFLNNDIGKVVLEELAEAVEAQIAVAFFNPNTEMLEALGRVAKLELIVSEEFVINDPYKLEQLKTATFTLRSIPTDAYDGKLHSKVLIIKRRNGSYWTLLGSANLTHQGMFSNREACVTMESKHAADEKAIQEIKDWFNLLLKDARSPDLNQAKLIFNNRSKYRLVPRPTNEATEDISYWVLKTTSGSSGKSYWPMFQAEGIVAIGWSELPDPSKLSEAKLFTAVQKTYPHRTNKSVETSVRQIKQFVNLKENDVVLICRGYTATQGKDVHIHGIARVAGKFFVDSQKDNKWKFKHKAIIQDINIDMPRNMVADALGKQTLLQTIHGLEKTEFDRFIGALKGFGAHVEV